MKKIPTIFCHIGNQEYLRCAIDSAVVSGNDVILLGDNTNKLLCPKWVDQTQLDLSIYTEFVKVYKHLSTNSIEFELRCFKRFFLIKSFMECMHINACFMVDSDVLLFQNLNKLPLYDNINLVISRRIEQPKYGWTVSPHIFYCTLNVLNEFIDFLFYEYTYNVKQLIEKYDYYKNNKKNGGVCDMTLLYLWCLNRNDYLNLCTIENPVFDLSVQSVNQFSDKIFIKDNILKMKKILSVNDEYKFCLNDGTLVKAAAIHFQGTAKSVMPDYWNKRSYPTMIVHRYLNYMSKSFQKITDIVLR